MLAKRLGAMVLATDTIEYRRTLSERFGALAFDPREPDFEIAIKAQTNGRGADAVVVATNVPGIVEQALHISRPGAKILLFAQTSATERIEISGADVCVGERVLLGSYSADVDLQAESPGWSSAGNCRSSSLFRTALLSMKSSAASHCATSNGTFS